MSYCVIKLNDQQADDFLRKYMQNNISVVDFSYDDEDDIFFITLKSGKLFRKVYTEWQYRGPFFGGLCFGRYQMEGTGKRFDIDYPNSELIAKATKVVEKFIDEWNKISPV